MESLKDISRQLLLGASLLATSLSAEACATSQSTKTRVLQVLGVSSEGAQSDGSEVACLNLNNIKNSGNMAANKMVARQRATKLASDKLKERTGKTAINSQAWNEGLDVCVRASN